MNNHRGITASLVAVIVVIGAGYLDWYILQNGLPKSTDTANVVVMVLTAWNGLAGVVASYYFGASHDSARQAEIKANVKPTVTVPPPLSTETKP